MGFEIKNGILEKYIEKPGVTEVVIPDSVKKIEEFSFCRCTGLTSVTIPDGVKEIESCAFADCTGLTSVMLPNSLTDIGYHAFDGCFNNTIICSEGSYAHKHAVEEHLNYIFDYQFKAFQGVVPPGIKQLASPFESDEEQPFVFISYSHKDREPVLKVIKNLYESGWRIWYDEGLTIGDSYDKTLEEHVKNCSAFLLFATENSAESRYIKDHEIPWAIQYNKPIIKCATDDNSNAIISDSYCFAVTSPEGIEDAFAQVPDLAKGEKREAKGISVAVDPGARELFDGDGFAYCLYSSAFGEKAKTILLEAERNGCKIYDAVKNGESEKKLENCASFVVFLDKAFLSDSHLTQVLIDEYQKRTDLAICQTEEFADDDLPEQLKSLSKTHWLVFTHAITADMHKRLAIHLQKRGCRNTAVLPGLEYEKTDEGIVIKRYTGTETTVRIESEYGGIPVTRIADGAFKNCIHLENVILPDSLYRIGFGVFAGCVGLTSITIPEDVTEIDKQAFYGCTGLTSITIPDGVTKIASEAFASCSRLTSIAIPDSVISIGDGAFRSTPLYNSKPDGIVYIGKMLYEYKGIMPLGTMIKVTDDIVGIADNALKNHSGISSITIPDSVTNIGNCAFSGCSGLTSITIPGSLKTIGMYSFSKCTGLTSIVLPDGAKEIGFCAFNDCTGLISITIPNSITKIDWSAFKGCPNLTIHAPLGSYAEQYAKKNNIPFVAE